MGDASERYFRETESYTQKVRRLEADPKVARTARFLAELRAVEAGWDIPVGLPVEGTDLIQPTKLTAEAAQDLAGQVDRHLLGLCESSRDAVDFIYHQAGYQIDIELGLATAPLVRSA